ncbi:MAG: hypothetical protein EHM70_23125 [Chloroflexota bacterium]|nr:MAG: hypothetical protein EHM70_23125 [Chloroflexota bacterium]
MFKFIKTMVGFKDSNASEGGCGCGTMPVPMPVKNEAPSCCGSSRPVQIPEGEQSSEELPVPAQSSTR